MNAISRGLPLLLALFAAQSAFSQATPGAPNAAPAPTDPAVTRIGDPYMQDYSSRARYRSRTAPQSPARDPDSEYGYRNPGGVGRMQEFYPPGNTFQVAPSNTPVATFGSSSGATSRASQMAAQQVGIARSQVLNEHIDNYSRPLGIGYGMGFGFGGMYPR